MRRTLMALLGIIILTTTAASFAGVCGDVNNSGTINALDVTRLINYLYKHGPAPDCGALPQITIDDVSEITQTTAKCGGTITSDGGAMVIARGVCWSTNPTPTVVDDNKTIDGSGIGSFISIMTGLAACTKYYVRAYAISSVGIGYSSVTSFATPGAGCLCDIDGNVYQTVTIGTQVWMAENLKVTRYRNGDTVPNVTDNTEWGGLSTGAYCEYNNDQGNVATYGRLYNWYAVSDARNIAPVGWHVPSDAELQALIDYVGSDGGKLKETGTIHWLSPNVGATNESGFTALPAGYRLYSSADFYDIQRCVNFWSSTEDNFGYPLYIGLHSYDAALIHASNAPKIDGFSIRCVKD